MPVPTIPLTEELSLWHHSFPPLEIDPQSFYTELSRRIQAQGMPNVELGLVEFRESGLLSAKRGYLRVIRGEFCFDICGAPFGSQIFFVSCRLGQIGASGCGLMTLGCLAMVPGIGFLVERRANRTATCYETDTATIYCGAVQSIVHGYLDELCETSKLAPLQEHERKPNISKLGGT